MNEHPLHAAFIAAIRDAVVTAIVEHDGHQYVCRYRPHGVLTMHRRLPANPTADMVPLALALRSFQEIFLTVLGPEGPLAIGPREMTIATAGLLGNLLHTIAPHARDWAQAEIDANGPYWQRAVRSQHARGQR